MNNGKRKKTLKNICSRMAFEHISINSEAIRENMGIAYIYKWNRVENTISKSKDKQ